jgi:hypothetical protein
MQHFPSFFSFAIMATYQNAEQKKTRNLNPLETRSFLCSNNFFFIQRDMKEVSGQQAKKKQNREKVRSENKKEMTMNIIFSSSADFLYKKPPE